MNKNSLASLAFALLATPSLAAAQNLSDAPWAPPPPVYVAAPQPQSPSLFVNEGVVAPKESPRFRFGIAPNLTVGLVDAAEQGVSTGMFGVGLTLDLGVQVSRNLAVYARGSASTLILLNQASLYGVVEYSPVDGISLGTGLGWDGMATLFVYSDVEACCGSGRSVRSNWGALSIPAIVGFNFGQRDASNGRLRAFRLGLEGAVGVEPGSGAVGWHAALSLGYVSM